MFVWWIINRETLPTTAGGRKCQPPPMLKSKLPFGIDSMLMLMKSLREFRFPVALMELHDQMGDTYGCMLFGMRSIRTRDPRNIKAILATQFEDYGLAQERKAYHSLLGNTGIFVVDGVSWSHSRALLRPSFDRTNVADLSQLEGFMQNFFSRINESPQQPFTHARAVELQELFQCLTMDSSTNFLFGEPIGALTPKKYTLENDEMTFDQAFDIAQYGLAMRAPLSSFYWLHNGWEFRKACSTARSQAGVYVSNTLRKLGLAEKKAEKEGLGKKYVFLEELAERTQDPQVLQDQVLNVMLAGRDTTAALLSWTFLCLAKHPEVFKKLRAEISAVIGVDENARLPTQAELRNILYLRWIIQEVLRLYPPVAINARRALHATTLPYGGGPDRNSPISIRKGERVVYSTFSLHRRTEAYGPDAQEFRPERWGEEALRKVGWSWIPFNGGPRICIGQQMALTHASYFIARMMQVYKGITLKDSSPVDDAYDTKLVMASGRGVHVFLS